MIKLEKKINNNVNGPMGIRENLKTVSRVEQGLLVNGPEERFIA